MMLSRINMGDTSFCGWIQDSCQVTLAIVFGFLLLTFNSDAIAAPMTLAECYREILKTRETLNQRKSEVRAAEARYDQAIAELFPRVGVAANQRLRDNPFFGSLIQGGFSDPSTGLPRSRALGRSQFETIVTVSQPLFRGFREFAVARASTAEQASLSSQLKRDRELLYLDVANLFLQFHLYADQEVALSRSQQTLQTRINQLNDFIRIGKARESERFAAEAELAQQSLIREQTRRAFVATKEILASLLTRDATEITLAPLPPSPQIPTLEPLLARLDSRADVVAQSELVRMAEEMMTVEERAWWPTLDLDFNSIVIDDPNRNRDWEALVRLSVPLFDGGRISSRVAEQQTRLRQAQSQMREQRRIAEQELRVAFQSLVHSRRARQEAKKVVSAREKNYQAQSSDYIVGRVTNLDVLTAFALMQQSDLTWIESRFTEATDFARLKVASGEVEL